VRRARLGGAVLVLGLGATACGGRPSEAPGPGKATDLGTQTANITADTAVMRQASAAANTIVRNATDCDAVKAALPETTRVLDEAESKIRTETGRVTLAALRSQVKNVVQACP
jgi:hypothetical protein